MVDQTRAVEGPLRRNNDQHHLSLARLLARSTKHCRCKPCSSLLCSSVSYANLLAFPCVPASSFVSLFPVFLFPTTCAQSTPWLLQLARGGLNKKKAPPALKTRLTQIRRRDARSGNGGSGRRVTDGASSATTTTSTAGATATSGQRNHTSSSTSLASTETPPRRSYKRPRMMCTPPIITAGMFSNSASFGTGSENGAGAAAGSSLVPVQPLVRNSSPSSSRYVGSLGSGGSSSGGLATVPPCLPAASDVRMGQVEVHALVRRLRDVAVAERERRASSSTASAAPSGGGRGGGLSRGAGSEGQPRQKVDSLRSKVRTGEELYPSTEVVATMRELRRVAIHGDATTLDVLLSSQVLLGGDGGGGEGWFDLLLVSNLSCYRGGGGSSVREGGTRARAEMVMPHGVWTKLWRSHTRVSVCPLTSWTGAKAG